MSDSPIDPSEGADAPTVPPGFGPAIWRAALLGNIHDAGFAIPLCTSGWEQDRFFNTRATRQKALQCMRVVVECAALLPDDVKAQMPEIEWGEWEGVRPALFLASQDDENALWVAMHHLVPETLTWLQRYRRSAPELFVYPQA